VAVAVTDGPDRALTIAAQWLPMTSIARPRQRHVEFTLKHSVEEFMNPIA